MKTEEMTEASQAPNGISEQPKPEPEEVDYYAGIEHAEPEAYDACAGSRRMPRGTRPEDGEQPIQEEGE